MLTFFLGLLRSTNLSRVLQVSRSDLQIQKAGNLDSSTCFLDYQFYVTLMAVVVAVVVGVVTIAVETLVAIPKNWQDHIGNPVSHLNRGRLYVLIRTCRAERERLSSTRATLRFLEESLEG